ncbi:hypothetical protein [Azospira sp. I09]|uniref:hypothetical protein n=1 Tax=Azospira sp. I09 TaxID=1765049 RepID=UPI001260BBE6|nr:hypothetical protein [Azospira sp. I09]BBN87411.1 hypothetical protein AZSP09_04340 [Azospira sp. I09]
MLEIIIQIVGEFLLQAILEVLGELGLRTVAEPFSKPPNPYVAAWGYAIFGLLAGGLSLLLLPHHLVEAGWRWANLLVTPLAAGLLMSLLGAWRAGRGQTLLRIDRFAYGFLFALALALVRFRFAQ